MSDIALDNLDMDTKNLFIEENITDLKVGNIRRLTPINADGTIDESRTAVYSATTNIMTPGGALPISGEIKAATLEEAVAKFPDAINAAVKKLQEDMIRIQQEQANQIITPSQLRGRNNDLII